MWDAAFAIQAIIACNLNEDYGPMLRKAHDFAKASQVLISLSYMWKKTLGCRCQLSTLSEPSIKLFGFRFKTILQATSLKCTDTYRKVHGHSQCRTRVGKSLTAQLKDSRYTKYLNASQVQQSLLIHTYHAWAGGWKFVVSQVWPLISSLTGNTVAFTNITIFSWREIGNTRLLWRCKRHSFPTGKLINSFTTCYSINL